MKVGPYELTERIGAGAQGAVWKARHTLAGGRMFAVRVLEVPATCDPEFGRRFRVQGQALQGLRHANILSVEDFGRDGEQYYVVMELVEGRTLADVLRERRPLPADEALRIIRQVCEALQAAHDAQVVHGAIRPENVFVQPWGAVKVGDFGRGGSVQDDLRATARLLEEMAGANLPTWLAEVLRKVREGEIGSAKQFREALEAPGGGAPRAMAPAEELADRLEEFRVRAHRWWRVYRPAVYAAMFVALVVAAIMLARMRRAQYIRKDPSLAPDETSVVIDAMAPISAMASSPDGRYLAVAIAVGNGVWMYDLGKKVYLQKTAPGAVRALAWHQTRVAAGTSDGRVVVWSMTGDAEATYEGGPRPVTAVALGKRPAAGDMDGTVRILGSPTVVLKGHQARINAMVWSEDGSLASGDEAGEVIVWKDSREQRRASFGVSVRAMASRDNRIIVGLQDGRVESLDGPSYAKHGCAIVALLAADRELISVDEKGRVQVCSLVTGTPLGSRQEQASRLVAPFCDANGKLGVYFVGPSGQVVQRSDPR